MFSHKATIRQLFSSPVPCASPRSRRRPAHRHRPPLSSSLLPLHRRPRPRFLVVLDPAHGGDDPGATLSEKLLEKDVTLALARRLRSELQARGIAATLARDADANLPPDQRAQLANAAHAAVFLSLHASTGGSGLRVATALLPPALESKPGLWVPWDRAQSPYLDTSRAVAEALVEQAVERELPSVLLAAPVAPLSHVTGAAVAVEIAPPFAQRGSPQALMSGAYQQQVAAALAAGLAAARKNLGEAGGGP